MNKETITIDGQVYVKQGSATQSVASSTKSGSPSAAQVDAGDKLLLNTRFKFQKITLSASALLCLAGGIATLENPAIFVFLFFISLLPGILIANLMAYFSVKSQLPKRVFDLVGTKDTNKEDPFDDSVRNSPAYSDHPRNIHYKPFE